MARTIRYALERGGPKRLAIKRRWFWRKTEVLLDDQPVGPPIANMAALRAGQHFTLPDGRRLDVGFERKLGSAGLTLALDGRPVPGAFNDPRTVIRTAGRLIWYIAGINLVIGAIFLGAREALHQLGYVTGAFGVLMALLGVGVYVYRSRAALATAIVLEIADTIAVIAFMRSDRPPVGPIIFRAFIVLVLVRAYQAVEHARRLDRDEKLEKAFD